MVFKEAFLIVFCCLIADFTFVSAGCPLGLEMQLVCKKSVQQRCGAKSVAASTMRQCRKKRVCRCPKESPFKWGSQCYKSSECPNKSLDAPSNNRTGHNFVVPGKLRNDGLMYGMHISALKLPPHWYHAIVLFRFQDSNCVAVAKKTQSDNPSSFLSINYRVPTKLVDLLVEGNKFTANIGLGAGPAFRFVKQCKLQVKKVLDLRRYDPSQQNFPQFQKFLLFGNDHDAFISHLPAKCKDYQQVVWLGSIPDGLRRKELENGVVIEIPSLNGQPPVNSKNQVIDPLTEKTYDIELPGCQEEMSEITIRRKYQFDNFIINLGCKA